MHRAAAHRAAWTTWTRTPRAARPTHQRLTRTHRSGIYRTSRDGARRPCGRHSWPGSAGRGSAGHCRRPRQPCHDIGARGHNRSCSGLAHQIRFCGWPQRTAAGCCASQSLRRGRSGCSRSRPRRCTGRRRNGRHDSARPWRTRRRDYGRSRRSSGRQWKRAHSRSGSRSIRCRRRHGLTRSRKNLARSRRGRRGTRWDYCSTDGRRTRRSSRSGSQWRA
jgi:hypothetical protein